MRHYTKDTPDYVTADIIEQESGPLDPEIFMKAMSFSSDLFHFIPTQVLYDLLLAIQEQDEKRAEGIEEAGEGSEGTDKKKLKQLLIELGIALENQSQNLQIGQKTIQQKIHELLSLLKSDLSNQELNQVLKGEKKPKEVLSQSACILWDLMFYTNQNNVQVPNPKIIDMVTRSSVEYAISDLKQHQDREIRRAPAAYETEHEIKDRIRMAEQREEWMREHNYEEHPWTANPPKYEREQLDTTRSDLDPIVIAKKLSALKVYVATMQGYDRDWDHDGGRGIDMQTGEIVDYDDVRAANGEDQEIERERK